MVYDRTMTAPSVSECRPLNDQKMWHAARVQISSLSGDHQHTRALPRDHTELGPFRPSDALNEKSRGEQAEPVSKVQRYLQNV